MAAPVIHHQLSVIGPNYHEAFEGENPVVPPKIAEKVKNRLKAEPRRYPRWIDATQMNEAISILQHHYEKRFQTAFNPLPKVVVKLVLSLWTLVREQRGLITRSDGAGDIRVAVDFSHVIPPAHLDAQVERLKRSSHC